MILRTLAAATVLSIAMPLIGCAEQAPAAAPVDWKQRFHRLGQWMAWGVEQTGEKLELDHPEGAAMLLGLLLLNGKSPELVLLSTVRVAHPEPEGKELVLAFIEGSKQPADTSESMFLDEIPKEDAELVESLSPRASAKIRLTDDEYQKLSTKLDTADFATKAVIAQRILFDLLYDSDALPRLRGRVDELLKSAASAREKEYWTLFRAALDLPGLPKAFEPPKKPTGRAACRESMSSLANAQMAYRVKKRTESFASNLQDLLPVFDGKPLPTCSEDGTYSVAIGVPARSFTIHCSIPEHDAGEPGEPRGYSPGLNIG